MAKNLSVFGLLLPLLASFLVLGSAPAYATILEVKAGYAFAKISASDIDDASPELPEFDEATWLSGDAIAFFPGFPLGVGARYEETSARQSGSGRQVDENWKRISVLASWRFIDDLVYLGPIFSFGVSNEFKYTRESSGSELVYKTKKNLSLTAGLETGMKLSVFRLGLEAGYLYANLGELKDPSSNPLLEADGSTARADLSGPYARALVGFGF